MGKRSDFPKVPKDLYQTCDPRAVAPLLPFLPQRTRFAEPCCGEYALIRQLERAGHSCYWASDIEDRWDKMVAVAGSGVQFRGNVADALTLTNPLKQADCIITNPPWTRTKKNPILHKLIEHFRAQNRAWLLIDSAWAFTQQSSPYMKYCSRFVAVGRVRWIPNTKNDGKDDAAWYCFEQQPCETIFTGR